MNPQIEVLYDKDGCIVVNKPPRLVSTGRTPDDPDCAHAAVEQQLLRKLWAVHQLDKDTSGVFILTDKKSLVQRFQQAMRDKSVGEKRYLAVVHGELPFKKRLVKAPILDDKALQKQIVHPDGKLASTQIFRRGVCMHPDNRRGETRKLSLVEVRLLTGRTHQIRVHMQHLGHPLVGEHRYIDEPCTLFARQMLHSWQIKFDPSPCGEGVLEVLAPPPWPVLLAIRTWFSSSISENLLPRS
ncbi:MAG: RNA pseudouridine synthase [Deltaproteobacteria bacterium]|nr:RNA pseudouridine synthase [Deltaproteobacteria bacterium]